MSRRSFFKSIARWAALVVVCLLPTVLRGATPIATRTLRRHRKHRRRRHKKKHKKKK